MVCESVIKVLERKEVHCGCDAEYYRYNGQPMAVEEKLLVEVYDPVTDEKYTKIVYWFRCLACGRLAKY